MKRRWNLQKAERFLADQLVSGQSKKEYCTSHGISSGTFYYWQRRIEESKHSDVGFVELQVEEHKMIEVRLSSGQWLAVRSSDVGILADVLLKIGVADG